jgi:hypothetical protein
MKRLTEVVDDEAAVAEPARGAAEEGAALGEREVVPHRGHGPAGVRVGVPEREHHGAARARTPLPTLRLVDTPAAMHA